MIHWSPNLPPFLVSVGEEPVPRPVWGLWFGFFFSPNKALLETGGVVARLNSIATINPHSTSWNRQRAHPVTPLHLAVMPREVPMTCVRSSEIHTPVLGENHALMSKNSRA